MFSNWSGWKTVKLILFVFTGFVPVVPVAWQPLASTVLAAIGSIVVVLSGTPMGPTLARGAKS